MNLSECLERMATILKREQIPFAVAGGMAASLYRTQPRLTADVDFAIALDFKHTAKLESLIKEMGMQSAKIRQAELDGGPLFAIKQKSSPAVMITGRMPGDPGAVGVDFMMNTLPWVDAALSRAGVHQVDFGFGKLPVLTLEDVLISKLYAMRKSVFRPKDLDDVLSIYERDTKPDLIYIKAQLDLLCLKIPPQTKRLLPAELKKLLH
jgi:predicted nucleotidyltransferase component of viral defense system